MKINIKHLLLFCCLVVSCMHTNAADEQKYNKKKYLKAADEAFKQGSIFAATDLYLEILKNSPGETAVYYNLAQTYFLARDYENAAKYFYDAYMADSADKQIALYYAALNTKMQGKYTEAIPMFLRFIKVYKADDAVKMKKWARTEIDGCNFALKESTPDALVKLQHLDKSVNSNYADLAPALLDDELFFASIHSDTVLTMNSDLSNSNKEDVLMKMYKSKVRGTAYGEAVQCKQFSEEGKHISNGAFNSEGNKFFYTICEGELLKPDCRIYMSKLNGDTWEDGKPLGEEINLKGFTNTQPYYAKVPVGSDVLFFVSNREGGKGGTDIWYSTVNKKGDFGTPKLVIGKVNTDRDEVTPFYDSETNTLYFSSNGWISMGGSDAYKTQADAYGKFNAVPENLGAPFNSPCDDNYFRFGKNSEQGYLVSNRPGIFSVRGKTCCYDIFSYSYDKRIYVAVKGSVIDAATGQAISGAAVNLSMRSNNIAEGDVTINTDTSKGNTPYFFNLKTDKLYKVTAFKEGYFTSSQNFATQGVVNNDTLTVDIYLNKLEKNKAYRLGNIYYDFDKSDLRAESKATLDTLYNILTENPTIIIELGSHTDTRGSDDYNAALSQKRAESCVNYLINERGIAKGRISAKGYGESKPLGDCSKEADCPQDQSGDCACHQLNRRTEFKVVGELDGDLINED